MLEDMLKSIWSFGSYKQKGTLMKLLSGSEVFYYSIGLNLSIPTGAWWIRLKLRPQHDPFRKLERLIELMYCYFLKT